MARLGVIASMQPCHLPGDIANANAAWPRARRNAYPFRRMLERGVTLAFGSDMPIEEPAPWRGLWGATYRAEWGADAHGIWFPEQRTTMREALYAFTRGAAMSVGDEAGGILRPGAGADMALWSDDPRRTRSRECAALAALGSIVGGGDPIWAK